MKLLKQEEEEYRPLLTPLIDVVLLLLIFFMVSTVFIDFQRQLTIELPESEASIIPEEKEPHILEMTREGRIHLDGIEVSLARLKTVLERRPDIEEIVIRADRKLPYGNVVRVMGYCKDAGISKVGAAVLPEQEQQ